MFFLLLAATGLSPVVPAPTTTVRYGFPLFLFGKTVVDDGAIIVQPQVPIRYGMPLFLFGYSSFEDVPLPFDPTFTPWVTLPSITTTWVTLPPA